MNYQKVKDIIVTTNNWLPEKKFKWFVIKLLVFYMATGLALATLAFTTFGLFLTLVVLCLSIYMFSLCMDMSTNSEKSFKRVKFLANTWFIPVICAIAVTVVLTMFNFL